nr:uncharacterized protein LOC129274512 [Lytechinus pictus]
MAGDEICGTNMKGLYTSDSCVAPGYNYSVVAPSRECLITFSVPSNVSQLEILVIDVVDADVNFTITFKDTTGKWSSAVDNDGTTILFTIPAGTGPNEVIREPLGSLAPHEVEKCRIQFQPTGFSEFHIKTNFDVCTTIDYCVPKQPGMYTF